MNWMKGTFAGLLSVAALFSSAAAQDKPQEPTREVHLVTASTPRERQIALALSAAPTEVSSKAAVYVLGPKGYEKVREGTNGFSCLIERSFGRHDEILRQRGMLRRRGQPNDYAGLPAQGRTSG